MSSRLIFDLSGENSLKELIKQIKAQREERHGIIQGSEGEAKQWQCGYYSALGDILLGLKQCGNKGSVCPKCKSDLINTYSDDCEDSDGNEGLCEIHECMDCGQKFMLF